MELITFVDSEISPQNGVICDLGAVKANDEQFHSPGTTGEEFSAKRIRIICRTAGSVEYRSAKAAFSRFISDAEFVCGHNIIHVVFRKGKEDEKETAIVLPEIVFRKSDD